MTSNLGASEDVPRANVGFVVGGRAKFGDETAELLRRRLIAVTLALTVILSAAFVGNLIQGTNTALWFRVATLVVLCGCLVKAEVAPPSTVNAEVPEDLERVVLRCLQKKPDDRYPNAASLEKELAPCKCTSDWTVEAAAAWWGNSQKTKAHPASRKDRTIEMTVDVKQNETTTE